MADITLAKPKEPSELEKVQLFYEAIPAPDYIQKAAGDAQIPKKSTFRERRIARTRK